MRKRMLLLAATLAALAAAMSAQPAYAAEKCPGTLIDPLSNACNLTGPQEDCHSCSYVCPDRYGTVGPYNVCGTQ